MADFLTAYKRTVLGIEGGYDPGTNEAETYRGIDRSQQPHWAGWAIIDLVKKGNRSLTIPQLNTILNGNTQLQLSVQSFYKTNFWNVLSLDKIESQIKANALFDCSVNPCIISVVKAAQIACNVVKPKLLVVDGKYGNQTLSCINSIDAKEFDLALSGVRTANYYERVRLAQSQATWLSSWLYRSQRQA